ncbi:hypothetical protein P154DRAFT_552936 [Amniculicola lignicola CBS 123094]|uniref:C2H2-type domain-containing protein n=1 Tax=Amniculicola lignicola CBS 123094 TaxID=1392246 RepID=A0A6A5WS00_9PLEO|nr:hypothetical protein P154DRAFT_552936 [Amniculicola lignicola CBS 123094]
MAANYNNSYNYPYQQSSAQQYAAYQTAPAAGMIPQASRQYQQPQPAPVATAQAADYMSYQAPSYSNRTTANYGGAQDAAWTATNNYGGQNRETARVAAEVLHNMSNTGTSHAQQQQPLQATRSPAYGHAQPRPRSANATRRTAGMAASAQYDYSNRQLPHVEATRTAQPASSIHAANTYNYADTQAPVPAVQPTVSNSVPDQYNQTAATTVDPMAVYDPWPEYQRKQEATRVQKAAENAVRAEEERIAAEDKRVEDETKAEEERKRKEDARPKQVQQKQRSRQNDTVAEAGESSTAGPSKEELEAQIREMMAKMREFNNKDPALLARIWEEERKAKGPKSPTTQTSATSQSAVAQPVAAQAVQANVPQAIPHAANSRKRARPKDSANGANGPQTPVQVAPSVATMAPPPAHPVRKSGSTVWPEEKKGKLAMAAAQYLNEQNPDHGLSSDKLLVMLNSDPSYLDLCKQLEDRGLRLDRAAFAKFLLEAVPDVNSSAKQNQSKPPTVMTQRVQAPLAPPAIVTAKVSTLMAPSPAYTPAVPSLLIRSSYLPLSNPSASASPAPAHIAEMVPIKSELKAPANKEEAARKRNFNDLIDLTTMMEDEEPPLKRHNGNSFSPGPVFDDNMEIDQPTPMQSNFPAAISVPSPQMATPTPANEYRYNELRSRNIVQPLDKKNALRRNGYNISTIARDVLLACGRHPDERQLNAHLEVLKSNLPQVDDKSDLSTLRWDLIDPGQPPRGYYKSADQIPAEDADDEDDSDHESGNPRPITQGGALGAEATVEARAQALLPGTNPFKQKRRGRPPRHSLPATLSDASSETPHRPSVNTNMSSSAPRPASASVGYSTFREVRYGPDGKPIPKKKGRPVGWRKAIHGSAAAQGNTDADGLTGPLVNRFVPPVPSALRDQGGPNKQNQPIIVSSRSPSLARQMPQLQSFKCKWNKCTAELHNLETLKKHIHKVHRKETPRNTLECLWGDCGKEVTHVDQLTNMRIEQHLPFAFSDEGKWKDHLQTQHFGPLSWELGDGPASGLSDAHDSEAYLSDAQGRRVTPRITAGPERVGSSKQQGGPVLTTASPAPRGRGRPPKAASVKELEAQEAYRRLLAHKKRIGGVGMDRGGATLANDKRRKGFADEEPEEFVDAE